MPPRPFERDIIIHQHDNASTYQGIIEAAGQLFDIFGRTCPTARYSKDFANSLEVINHSDPPTSLPRVPCPACGTTVAPEEI